MKRFASRFVSGVRQWLGSLASRFKKSPRLRIVRTDEMPERPSPRHLYVVGERGEDWYAAMVCPCGCRAVLELNLVPSGRPCWKLTTHHDESPSLFPSVWRQVGCRAHFFMRQGRIVWARAEDSRADHPTERRLRRNP